MLEAKVVELSDELANAKKRIKQLEETQVRMGFHSKFVILNNFLTINFFIKN